MFLGWSGGEWGGEGGAVGAVVVVYPCFGGVGALFRGLCLDWKGFSGSGWGCLLPEEEFTRQSDFLFFL